MRETTKVRRGRLTLTRSFGNACIAVLIALLGQSCATSNSRSTQSFEAHEAAVPRLASSLTAAKAQEARPRDDRGLPAPGRERNPDARDIGDRVNAVEKRLDDLEKDDPYWSFGMGYGVVLNATDGDDNDASGILLHFKAYPWQRAEFRGEGVEVPCWHDARRLSVIAGASVGDFTGGGLDGPAWVFGAGYDFTNELAFVAGISVFETEEVDADTDWRPYFGFSLDINLFKRLVGGR